MDNLTFNNTTQPLTDGKNILIILLDSLILVLSLCGNSLVIYTISKERKLQTTCNYLLLNLAICDIVVVSLGTAIDIMLQFTKSKWILGKHLCRTLNPAMTMFYISGSLILVIISIDRYKMFVHPLRARYQRKHVKYAVIIVHLISLTCVLPFAVFSTIIDGHCYDVWPALGYRKGYTIFLFLMQYALPLLIMGAAYGGVALSLMRNKSSFKENFSSPPKRKYEATPMKSVIRSSSSLSSIHANNLTKAVNHPVSKRREPFSCKQLTYGSDEKGKYTGCEQFKSNNRYTNVKENGVNNCENTQYSCPKETSAMRLKQGLSTRLRSPPSYRRNAIRKKFAESKRHHSSTSSYTERDRRNNRALKMILLVVVVFALFMLPMQIMSLLLDFGGKPTPEKFKIYVWFVMWSYFGSCTLNPFIYGLVDRTFRAGFKKFAKKIAGYCRCTLIQSEKITNL